MEIDTGGVNKQPCPLNSEEYNWYIKTPKWELFELVRSLAQEQVPERDDLLKIANEYLDILRQRRQS